MKKQLIVFTIVIVVFALLATGFVGLFSATPGNHSAEVGAQPYLNGAVNSSQVAVALTDDSMGNLFVLWNNGNIFEHPDLGSSTWVYLGNAASFTSYNNKSINLGSPVGIRASYNWETPSGTTTGMLMVLFSNGYAAYMAYGENPHVWQLTKLPSGNNFVALSYNLNDYAYVGAHNQVFYATEQNGTTYGYSDKYYGWSDIITTPVDHNITAVVAWPNNFAPPALGTIVLLSVSKSGYVYFFEGTTNPLSTGLWVSEGKITSTAPNPYFDGLTQTSNPSSPYYYYAIERQAGTDIYASGLFNGTASSFSPVSSIPTTGNQTALQNKYFGFVKEASELILTSNGTIYQTTTEGATFELLMHVPVKPIAVPQINVMPWIYQSGSGVFSGLNRLKASLEQTNQTSSNFTMVSYEFYQLQSNATITPLSLGTLSYANSSNPDNITPYIHKLGLGAVPMIISASSADIYHFASNNTYMVDAINQMTYDAVLYNYSGYDIDWEPSSSNNTTGIMFTNFLNEFSLTLNKFDKKLFVEVASWDPNFWNYTNLGMSNVTSVNIMDYAGLYSGPSSFVSELQLGISQIPLGKLSIALMNTNPNTNLNFTGLEMEQRFSLLEQDRITFISLWDMPFNISLVSQIEDFEENHSGVNNNVAFAAGSSGISTSTVLLSGATSVSGSMEFGYFAGDYLDGNSTVSTNFMNTTRLDNFAFDNLGTKDLYLSVENETGWHYFAKLTSTTTGSTSLPAGTYDIAVTFGNFTGVFVSNSYSGKITYTVTFSTLSYKSWVSVYYLTGASVMLNGTSILSSSSSNVVGYGTWSIDNVSLAAGSYNVSVEKTSYSGFFDNVVTSSGNTSFVYTQTALVSGYIKGTVSTSTATVLINGAPVTVTSGSFNFSGPAGKYYVNASAQFYRSVSYKVTVSASSTTYVNMSLSYLPPVAVVQYTPLKVNNTTFSFAWSQFYGTDFVNYSIYVSTVSSTLGNYSASLTSVSDTNYNITGLASNTTFYVTIVTYAQNGHSRSNVERFTTPPHATIPTTPVKSAPPPTTLYIVVGVIVAAVVIGAIIAVVMRGRGLKK